VLLDQRREVNAHQPALIDDFPAVDDGNIHPRWSTKDNGGERVVQRPGVFQPIEADGDEIGALSPLERPEIVAAQDGRAAPGRQLQRLARRQQRIVFIDVGPGGGAEA
jgi:hypothetical protein